MYCHILSFYLFIIFRFLSHLDLSNVVNFFVITIFFVNFFVKKVFFGHYCCIGAGCFFFCPTSPNLTKSQALYNLNWPPLKSSKYKNL